MTDKEKAVIMAYTGVCMLAGDKLSIFYKYVEDLLGIRITTLDLLWLEGTIKEKAKPDFIALCKGE